MSMNKSNQSPPRRLSGIFSGAYTCTNCNQSSRAAVQGTTGYEPLREKHGRVAERQGTHVIWQLPKGKERK